MLMPFSKPINNLTNRREEMKTEENYFDRLRALEAMYYLKELGFAHPNLKFTFGNNLYLGCGARLNGDGSYPDIEIDDIHSWSTDQRKMSDIYWWLFD